MKVDGYAHSPAYCGGRIVIQSICEYCGKVMVGPVTEASAQNSLHQRELFHRAGCAVPDSLKVMTALKNAS